MITTSLPAAVSGCSIRSPSTNRFAWVRYSIAGWIPLAPRPGTVSSRGTLAPVARTTASKRDRSSEALGVRADPSDVHPGAEPGALGAHLLQPALEVALLELELGDPVAQQPAEAVVALEHHHGVPGTGQLLGGGQPRRSGADHGDGAAGLPNGFDGPDP